MGADRQEVKKKDINPAIREKLEILLKDPEFELLEEDRQRIELALSGESDESPEEILEWIEKGDALDELQTLLEAKNFNNANISRMRELMKQVGDVDIILKELKSKLIQRYFDLLSDDYGKKPYIFPYNNVPDEDMFSYLKFELIETIEEKEEFIIKQLKEGHSHILVVLLATHLNAYPSFFGRLLTRDDVSEEELQQLLAAIAKKSKKETMSYKVLNYFLFNPKRRKLINSCIRNGCFFPSERIIKRIRKLDREFFKSQKFRSNLFF